MGKNDWIVASINNPSFSSEDMEDIFGMTIDNTLMLSKQAYKNSPYIKNHIAFKNEDGSFSETKFDQFYEKALKEWDKFTNNEKIDSYEYSLFHTRSEAGSRVKNPNFRIETVLNPDLVTIGIAGWNQTKGKKLYTPSELAQMQKIYDPSTGTYLDETPNDRALFNSPIKWVKNLFEEPLVLATYDEDTEEFDPFSGKVVLHKKGEYKLNSDGTYYSEKLNGRSVAGKQIIHNTDLITVDDSSINKYDFFDSDSIDKSVVGTILKSAATVAPLLIGGPVSAIYSGLLIGREMTKTLPMLYSMTTSLFGNEEESDFLNTLAGYGEKFTGGVSEYGSQHTFSFEQFGRLIGDVATQWGQQQLIARSVSKLRGSNKVLQEAYINAAVEYDQQLAKALKAAKTGLLAEAETAQILRMARGVEDWTKTPFGMAAIQKYLPKALSIVLRNARLGADAALAYMALVSNYDVYNTMLEKGSNHKDAALVALGSTIGMFSVDRFLHLGEMFFNDLEDLALKALRTYAVENATKYSNILNSAIGKTEQKIEGNFFKRVGSNARIKNVEEVRQLSRAINLGRSIAEEFSNSVKGFQSGLTNYTLGFAGKALGEGLEEVSEEFVSDVSKQLYEWAGQYGFNTSSKDAGAWENWQERYAMSLFGGMAGGAMFYGVGKFNEAKERQKNPEAYNAEDEMIYLLRQGKKSDLIRELNKLHDKGKLGSTKLGIESELDEKGNRVYLSAQPGQKTQNDVVFDRIAELINILESYINNYGANLSDDELFRLMVLGNERLLELKSYLEGDSYASGYLNEFLETLKNVINALTLIDNTDNSLTDLQKRRLEIKEKNEESLKLDTDIEESNKIKTTAEQDLAKYKKELSDFLLGKKSLEYARKTIFLADPNLQSIWSFITFELWLKKKHNKDVKNLSLVEKNEYLTEYLKDLKAKNDFRSDEIWASFLELEKAFTPFLLNLEENGGEVLKVKQEFDKIFETLKNINSELNLGLLGLNDKLPNETDEEYKDRYKVDENLSDEDKAKEIAEKIKERLKVIDEYNRSLQESQDYILKQSLKILEILSNTTAIDPYTYRAIRRIYADALRKGFLYKNIGEQAIVDNDSKLTSKYLDFFKKVTIANIDRLIDIANTKLLNNVILTPELIESLSLDIFKNPENIDEYILKALQALDLDPEYDSYVDENSSDKKSDDELISLLAEYKTKLSNPKLEVIDNANGLEKIKEAINAATTLKDFEITLANAISGKFQYIEEVMGNSDTLVLSDASTNNLKTILEEFLSLKYKLNNLPFDSNIYGKLSPELIANSYDELKNQPKLTFVNEELLKDLDNLIDFYKSTIESSIKSNPINNILEQINNKLSDINPIKNILSIIGLNNIDEVDLDLLLAKIENKIYDIESELDFSLTSYEENQLRFFSQLLNVANGFIYQSSTTPNWLSPFGHARFFNDFVAKNSEIIDGEFHIPELDVDLGIYYSQEVQKYRGEIDYLLKLHETNSVNKKLLEIKASQQLEQVKTDFYKKHAKELFMLLKEVRGIRLNLLDKDIPDDATSSEIETELANGLMRILNQGITLTEFLSESQILEKLCTNGDLSELLYPESAILDSKLNDLSSYLKVQFLLSALLYNKSKFDKNTKANLEEEKKKDEGNRIAPLTSQLYLIQSIKGFINESEAISEIYDYIKSKINTIYTLDQCIIVSGVGGAGKTNAVIKQAILDLNRDLVWLIGPTLKQAQNLKEAVGKDSRLFDRETLLNEVIKDRSKYPNNPEGSDYFDIYKDNEGRATNSYYDNGNLDLKTPPNNLKVIVIDEYTYFSKYDLLLINRWAKSKNIKVILSGDKHLLGHINTINDADRFCLFDLPKLTVSLRELNIHVLNNNFTLDNLLSTYDKTVDKFVRGGRYPSGENAEKQEKELTSVIFEQLKNSKLTYYLDDNKFNGTLINQEISEQLLNVLKKTDVEKIAVIGNSDRINKLASDLNIANKFDNIEQIQGREFDYVIFDGNIGSEDLKIHGESLLHRLQALYTLNTRGKEGVIIFDDSFSKMFPELSNAKEFNTISARALKDIVNEFIASEDERLSKLKLDGEYHDLTEYSKNPKKKNPETPEEKEKAEIADKIQSEEQQLKKLNTPEQIENQLQNLDKEHEKSESKLQESTLNYLAENSPIADQTIRGYFMPITGQSYTRVKDENGIVTYKFNKHTNSELNVVAKALGFDGDLTEDQMLLCVDLLETMVRNLLTFLTIGNNQSVTDTQEAWLNYCNIIKDISEGKAYITLEASDYNEGFKHVGLGTASSEQRLVEILNGKVYRYVLHFTGDVPKTSLFGLESSITLAFAANPETWEKKKISLDNEIKKLPENDPTLNDKKAELEKLNAEIENYKKVLLKVSETGSYKVTFKNAFTSLRPYYETIQRLNGTTETVIRKRRVETLVVEQKDGSKLVDSGWKSRDGKYKSKSSTFILGNDVDELGVKASQSGKCCMFVSELSIPEDLLFDTYMQEKLNGENTCFVRMYILDNAGINFTTLLNPSYSDLYKTSALTKDGKPKEFTLPFKSEVTGYRMLASMWNWRADLIQFIKLYDQNFSDVNREDIDKVVQLKYENQEIPEELKSLSDKIDTFNTKICADAKLHTFRLGGNKQHVLQITGFNKVEDYFPNSETISKNVREHGIFGLYLNYDTALRYKAYIDAIFSTFNGEGVAINEISVYNSNGEEKIFSAEENIDGYRLHSLSSKKTSSDQRAPGNSLTNFLDQNVDCNTITVNDGSTEISFNRVGSSSFLSLFPALFTHMCKILWVINRHSNDPDLNIDLGKIKFKSEDGKKEVELDMMNIKKLIQQSALPDSPEYFGKDTTAKPFEFMDMINYMFHGTLSDVSTHSLEWKNGKIVGGRDSWTKITGVMYPQGIFVDPRIDLGNQGYKSDVSDLSIHTTSINPAFLLTGVTSELVLNFDIHFDENNVKTKTIEFSRNQNEGGSITISSNEDITIDEVLEKYNNITRSGNTYYIDNVAYELKSQTSNSYTFTKVNSKTSTSVAKLEVSPEIMDNATYSPTTDLGGLTIEELVRLLMDIQDVPLSVNFLETPTRKFVRLQISINDDSEAELAVLEIKKEKDKVNVYLKSLTGETIYSTENSEQKDEFDINEVKIRMQLNKDAFKEVMKYLNEYKDYLIREKGFIESDFEATDYDELSDQALETLTC